MSVTIEDIANEAKVSIATVSSNEWYKNGKPRIKKASS